jgi:hypothetical protein
MTRQEIEAAGPDWIVQNCAAITVSGEQGHGVQLSIHV